MPQNPGEQRVEAEPFKPTPAEQPGEVERKAGQEHDPQLRELAKYLFGGISDQYAAELIGRAVKKYPELPPDEALREYDRRQRENSNWGFTF